jgi:hypothetical protein
MRTIKNPITKMKKRTLAIPAALSEMPPNPNIPAMRATIAKITAQRSIIIMFERTHENFMPEMKHRPRLKLFRVKQRISVPFGEIWDSDWGIRTLL